MATVITSECINCGACEPECPNTAIYQGGVQWELNGATQGALQTDRFYIVPEKCTECVGFHDQEACAAVCPVDCCVPDPAIPETEAVLIERARQLHPGTTFPETFPSRFKNEGAVQPAAAPAAAASAPAAAAPAAMMAAAPVAAAGPTLSLPSLEDWEVPIECHHCHGAYTVAFRHFNSGVVFRCPYCNTSYVVQTSMHNFLSQELGGFYREWQQGFEEFQERRQRELDAFEDRQQRKLQALNEKLRGASLSFKPPGGVRKRAGWFG